MVENVSPTQVWATLQADPAAALVDVRTEVEWTQIGLPDLSAARKKPILVSWQLAPSGQVNGAFMDQLRQSGLTPEHKIYFLCRSGVRSVAAALAAQAAGYRQVFNIADGFEGPPDATGHRGQSAGWQADGLPWQRS